MKSTRHGRWCAAILAASSVASHALEFGQIDVIQNDAANNTTSVTVSAGPGSSAGFSLYAGSNRGDYHPDFGLANDVDNGVMITSIRENGRDNTLAPNVGGPGLSYATPSSDRQGSGLKFFLPLHATAGGAASSGSEFNMNVAAAHFPFIEGWLGAHSDNSGASNGGTQDLLFAAPGINFGTQFVDRTDLNGGDTGIFDVNLSTLTSFGIAATPANGVLLVIGAKNEDNFAMGQDMPDGQSFRISNMDNGQSSLMNYERDGVAFVFIPTAVAGGGVVTAVGRIQNDGSAEVSGGIFTVTPTGTAGEWLLEIPGQTEDSGTLIVTAEGGFSEEATLPNNTNNFVTYQWDALAGTAGGWIIQSRDLPGATLEGGFTPDEDMFSFAFLTNSPSDALPVCNLTSPADRTDVALGDTVPVEATATDSAPGTITAVRFVIDLVDYETDTTPPFAATTPWPANALGNYEFQAIALDNELNPGISTTNILSVVPPSGSGGLYFRGLDDYVTFGNETSLGLQDFTLECWFKREGDGVAASTGAGGVTAIPLITKGRGEDDGSNLDCNYFLGIRASDGVLVADFESFSDGLNQPVIGTMPIQNGVWYHAAATFDSTTGEWRLYLNGNLDGVRTTGGRIPRFDSIQHAGIATTFDSAGMPDGYFMGYIDEARIWNTARTQGEIRSTCNSEVTSETNLVGRWDMTEGSGTTITSTAAGAVVGTLVNEAVWVDGVSFTNDAKPNPVITSPVDGSLIGFSSFPVEIDVTDDGTVTLVEVFDGTTKIGEDTDGAPYVVNYLNPTPGPVTLTAVATDDGGNVSVSDQVMVNIGTIQVSFQEGVDGYSGCLQRLVSDRGQDQTGSAVNEYFLDGPSGSSPDESDLLLFGGIFGTGTGQVPLGSTIIKAELTYTTATASGNAGTGGPFVVDRLLAAFDETTVYADLTDAINFGFPGARGASTLISVSGGFGRVSGGEVVTNDVTQIVRDWSAGEPNYGFAVYTAGTTDGWQVKTIGDGDVNKRPKLTITYGNVPPSVYEFDTDLSGLNFNDTGVISDGEFLDFYFLDLNDPGEGTKEGLFRFPVEFGTGAGQIPPTDVILQAHFHVTTGTSAESGNSQSNGAYTVHQILQDWDLFTDFSADGTGGPDEANGEVGPSVQTIYGMGQASQAWMDVTEIVRNWQNGDGIYGFNLKPGTGDGWGIFWPQSLLITDQFYPKLIILTESSATPSANLEIAVQGYNPTTQIFNVTITGMNEGDTYHLRSSTDAQVFSTLTPGIDFTSATPQPLEVPVDLMTTPALLLQAFDGPSVP